MASYSLPSLGKSVYIILRLYIFISYKSNIFAHNYYTFYRTQKVTLMYSYAIAEECVLDTKVREEVTRRNGNGEFDMQEG